MYVSMYRGAGMPIYTKLIARENDKKVILMTTKFYGYKTIMFSKKDTVVRKKATETTTTSLLVPT